MITRPELAAFIRKVADGEVAGYNWERFAVAHYDDDLLESVRVRLVRASISDEPMDRSLLLGLARELEGPAPPPIFFCDCLVIGTFVDGYPTSGGEVKYQPFRGLGHAHLQTRLRESHQVTGQFTRADDQFEFSIVGRPRYGVLDIGPPHKKRGEQGGTSNGG
jgi:hypothetical protein